MSSVEKTWSNPGPIENRASRIREKLQKELQPVELVIEDVSYQHAGHVGMKGRTDGETHFNVKIISKGFEGMNLVKRHRVVYDLLREELVVDYTHCPSSPRRRLSLLQKASPC